MYNLKLIIMKKQNFTSLKLNKKSISEIQRKTTLDRIKGGNNTFMMADCKLSIFHHCT